VRPDRPGLSIYCHDKLILRYATWISLVSRLALYGSRESVCLVRRAVENLKNVQTIDIALHVSSPMSSGSVITAMEESSAPCQQRSDGELVTQESSVTEQFDFGDSWGLMACFLVTLPDIVTIHKFFGVESIHTFANASSTAYTTGDLHIFPDGPTAEERVANPYYTAMVITTMDGGL
jgi:hypothetical protein